MGIRNSFHEMGARREFEAKGEWRFAGKAFPPTEHPTKDAEHEDWGVAKAYPLVEEVKKYIEANYSQKISAAQIAKTVHLSESRLRYLFKETYGITMHSYLLKTRILAAKRLLTESEDSIGSIAEGCGFGCQAYMNEVFKRELGMTPRQYRTGHGRRCYR